MNTPARRFILLVIAVVIAVGVLMAPRRNERIAIMRDEDQQAQIIAMLEPRLADNGDDTDVLATLGRSYGEIGNHRRAAELLERYVVLRPDDGEAYARLADLYKSTGDQARRIVMLERSIALKPRLSRTMELAGLYRDNQRTDEELTLLSRHEFELTLESGLLLRLAKLHVANGDRQRALHVLMRTEVLARNHSRCRARIAYVSGRAADCVGAERRGRAIGQAVDCAMARAMAGGPAAANRRLVGPGG